MVRTADVKAETVEKEEAAAAAPAEGTNGSNGTGQQAPPEDPEVDAAVDKALRADADPKYMPLGGEAFWTSLKLLFALPWRR